MFARIPLGVRIFLVSGLLVLIALVVAGTVASSQSQGVARATVAQSLEGALSAQRFFTRNQAIELEGLARSIGSNAAFAEYIAQAIQGDSGLGDSLSADVGSILDQLLERKDEYGFDFMIALDAEAMVMADTESDEAFEQSMEDHPLVARAISEGFPQSGYWIRDGVLYFASITAIERQRETVGALIVARKVADEIAAAFAEASGSWIVYTIIDPETRTEKVAAASIPRNDAERLLATVAEIDGGLNQMVEMTESAEPQLVKVANERIAVRARAIGRNQDQGRLGAVLVADSYDAATLGFQRLIGSIWWTGAVMLALSMIGSVLLGLSVTRPLAELGAAVESAADGDLGKSLPVSAAREVGRVSRSVNRLLSELREKRDMEGYIFDLSRYLPDPAQQPVAHATHTRARLDMSIQVGAMAVLGMDFRAFGRGSGTESASEVFLQLRAAVQLTGVNLDAIGAHLIGGYGQRFFIGFDGPSACDLALQFAGSAVRALRERGYGERMPVLALGHGELTRGALNLARQALPGAVGISLLQVQRLLEEAPPGALLLAPTAEGQLRQLKQTVPKLPHAEGGLTQKRFFALAFDQLPQLPATPASSAATAVGSTVALGAAAVPAARLPGPGDLFANRYEIQAVLGSGGMGMVYKARDIELADFVALKMLHASTDADRALLEALKSEIRIARKITHPNVVRTYDFGEAEGLPFISMEYVRGMTLRYLLRQRGRLPYSAALRIARQLCLGLEAAHREGVLHRDIKPENLILDQGGAAKLMDFGIARNVRLTDRAEADAERNRFVGTPAYAAPEQMSGDALDERTDIYACGILMSEMFCGELPFTGENTMDLYMSRMQSEPIKPSALWPECPPELEAVILKCISREPAKRYASARALHEALSELRA